ncbi:MAG: DUF2283 domain-containing protein [Gomphosphaeria aponina SAG 52.96 = DSM 107014]|uniref:DUF2283 domain-containing protein n=1 Tax=Gomphosphaeria aponina SAG 52.96 = DSM 107014 TaxID=1521640 RepID=A0A941JQH9_9CHRO|nr:DUF2283 domain-containing protein [Gomphosphaeria aponina SAG 52.96 = DSM 107014]
MDKKLSFEYDRVGDILYINKCSPYPEQESEEIEFGVIARFHPQTEEIENLEVLFFSKRLLEKNWFELPITANLRLATA